LDEQKRLEELEEENRRLREETAKLKRIRDLEEENRRLREEARNLQNLPIAIGREAPWTKTDRSRMFLFLAIFCGTIVLLSFLPITMPYVNKVFNPTKIPSDYQQVSDFITKSGGDVRVAWVPFYKIDSKYSWTNGKRIGPFNIYSYNPNLNNIIDVFNKDSYYYWFDNLFSRNPLVSVKLMEENLTVGTDTAAKLLVPNTARYMVLDMSKPTYQWANPFERDRSLLLVFQTKLLKVYRLKYTPAFIRAAGKTVKADTFFDNLAIAQEYPAEVQGSLAFINGDQKLDKRFGVVDLDNYKRTANADPGFEEWNLDDGFLNWKQQNSDNIQLVADGTTKTEGTSSLKVVNSSSATFALGWVTGSLVPTHAGEIISVESSVKHQNTSWTTVSIEGYNSYSKSWIRLAFCPSIQSGTSGWKRHACSFYVPAGITIIRPSLSAGWAADPKKGPGISWFDNVKISRIDSTFFEQLIGSGDSANVTYTKISAEKYKVHIKNASKPFVLVFGEAYDPLWRASINNGGTIQPVKLYSLINGFPIDRKGDFDLTITYTPQSWFIEGLVVSLTTLLLCVAFLLIIWKRKRAGVAENAGGTIGTSFGRAESTVRDYLKMPPRYSSTGEQVPSRWQRAKNRLGRKKKGVRGSSWK
jgi:hypothetical protein